MVPYSLGTAGGAARSEEERRALLGALRPHIGMASVLADEPILSSREVALLFRVSVATVRRWATAGRLSAVRSIGGHWTFPLAGIRRELERLWNATGPIEPQAVVGGISPERVS